MSDSNFLLHALMLDLLFSIFYSRKKYGIFGQLFLLLYLVAKSLSLSNY